MLLLYLSDDGSMSSFDGQERNHDDQYSMKKLFLYFALPFVGIMFSRQTQPFVSQSVEDYGRLRCLPENLFYEDTPSPSHPESRARPYSLLYYNMSINQLTQPLPFISACTGGKIALVALSAHQGRFQHSLH